MNASALIDKENTAERPMLGKVSPGPLGSDEHEEMLGDILAKNRKKNPVKVAVDNIKSFVKLIYHTIDVCNPSSISPEMRAEKVRPIPGEIISTLCCLITAGLFGLGFFYSTIDSVTTANKWEGPVDCLVVDKLIKDSISYESKLVIKLKDVEEETPVPELMPIGEDGFTGWGDEAFHCNIDVGTWDEDKLFGSGKKAAGPCCHTPFAINRREVNETFQCYYSFDTSYCNNELVTLSTDDDFRGMAKNTNENLDNAENLVSDVVNSMCCSEEVPSSVGAAMLMFVLACTIAAITLWCVFFRLKNGVWHMMCFFDNPPSTAMLYTTNRNVANIMPKRTELRERGEKKQEIIRMKTENVSDGGGAEEGL